MSMAETSGNVEYTNEDQAGGVSDQRAGVDSSNQQAAPDVSELRQPIALGSSDVRQLISCLRDGTEDVRSTLLDQCKLIYECKVCLSLFRGLPNFLAHKRVFCMNTEHADSFLLGSSLPDLTTVFVEPHGSDSEEEIEQKQQPKPSDMYRKIQRKLRFNRRHQKEAVIKLQGIDSNSGAVHQQYMNGPHSTPIRCVNSTDCDRSESVQPSKFHQSSPTRLLKSSSKARRSSLVRAQTVLQNLECKEMFKHIDFCNVQQLRCLRCDVTYQSFKSLKRHMFGKHKESSAAANFHCPKCKCPFSKFWNLTRHLLKRHKISAKELENFKQKSHEMRMKVAASIHAKFRNLPSQDQAEIGNMQKEADMPQETLAAVADAIIPLHSSGSPESVDLTPETSGISFQQGFSLLKCSSCTKVFGKKDSYEKHISTCDAEITFRSVHGSSDQSDSQENSVALCMECDSEGEASDPEEHSISSEHLDKTPLASTTSSSVNNAVQPKTGTSVVAVQDKALNTTISPKINKRELRVVRQIINRQENRCNRCGLHSKDPTSLYHHAITHLGWQQYKCKRCIYMSYNVADCKNHIRRGHPVWCAGKTDLSSFMVIVANDMRVPASRGAGQRANLRNVINSPKKLDI